MGFINITRAPTYMSRVRDGPVAHDLHALGMGDSGSFQLS